LFVASRACQPICISMNAILTFLFTQICSLREGTTLALLLSDEE